MYMYVCMYIYIYIYIYIHTCIHIYIYREREREVVFSSHLVSSRRSRQGGRIHSRSPRGKGAEWFRFRTFLRLIGSVRFGSENHISQFDSVRPALFGRVVARSGWVRFVSVSGSGRFQNSTVRFGSVRLGTSTCADELVPLAGFRISISVVRVSVIGIW